MVSLYRSQTFMSRPAVKRRVLTPCTRAMSSGDLSSGCSSSSARTSGDEPGYASDAHEAYRRCRHETFCAAYCEPKQRTPNLPAIERTHRQQIEYEKQCPRRETAGPILSLTSWPRMISLLRAEINLLRAGGDCSEKRRHRAPAALFAHDNDAVLNSPPPIS